MRIKCVSFNIVNCQYLPYGDKIMQNLSTKKKYHDDEYEILAMIYHISKE